MQLLSMYKNCSPAWLVLALAGVLFIRHVVNRVREHIHIKKIGHYGYQLKSSVPYGLDLVARAVSYTRAQQNYEYWRDCYFGEAGRYTVEARMLNFRLIFTAEPDNIRAMFVTQFADFGKGEPFHRDWKDFLGDSIFTTDGPKWRASRQLLRPQFTRQRVSDLRCVERHMEVLFRAIDNGGVLDGLDQPVTLGAGNGKVLDISELLFRFSLDVTIELLLGHDTKSLVTPNSDFDDAFNEVQRVQNILVHASAVRALIPKSGYWDGLKLINHFIDFHIERALRLNPEELASKGEERYNFLHAVAGFTRDRKVLRDQIVAILLAGRDSTASALSWALYELSRHPHAAATLRQEVEEVVGLDRLPTFDDLKKLTYTQNVIKETLRLYPGLPFNVRIALRDTTLPTGGGPDGTLPLAVPKNTVVGYSTLVMQRRADLYPPTSDKFADPLTWSPERWTHWQPRPQDYIPFSSGPRVCIGQEFAMTQMTYILARLFQRYEKVTHHMGDIDGGQPRLKTDIALTPAQGVRVAFWEARKES